MKTHLQPANPNEQSDTLLVFLPGAYLKPDEFEREGFIDAVRERHLAADALLVDADVSYYYEQTLSDRLHTEVIEPQRAKGYKSIWLVGISIGGFGALIHELARPGSVDGIVALAPYLGRRVLGAEIKKAGGLRAWQAPTGPQPDEEPDRKLWPFFQQYLEAKPSKNLPPLYLGFGLEDRFASNHKLLADALPPGRVFTTEGGHDWPQWRQLWRNVLDVLPLPAAGRSPKQTITQSQVTPPRARTATPWAIAA
ncbi:alpha/beta hydrolase-fold protein [Variovorax sp. NFACC27]|uniref:Alpha/beta hydrolase n=1 Tax=Variovorax gossypii TaxID=1679495 RepID=A0A431TTJ3_9BURK|nr:MULTISPECIES: alpha/beta hydrolase-fold protein [Variovorax]MDP9605195.1 pimeloyl-ACP methyl ester carboxylesterase [Variovorax paradoxus]SEF24053.1 Putative esterase [Variovorax sp. NFACC28]SEG23266.1 Putative esterase [Variovorax sp. NFACC29]SFC48557.1 Putative esterase [Variovorax sp. NFACC26]SFF93104.1 Putative esterase [Variovorax sp. NFACC27]